MAPANDLVLLGDEGGRMVRDRLIDLSQVSEVAVDGAGDSRVGRRWTVDLAELLVPRVSTGIVYDGAVLRRFLDANEFYVVPTDEHAQDPVRWQSWPDASTRYFVCGQARYWLIRLPVDTEARLQAFIDRSALMCAWSPLALAGDDGFQHLCDVLWKRPSASRDVMAALASSTSRILSEGARCGSYILWEASEKT